MRLHRSAVLRSSMVVVAGVCIVSVAAGKPEPADVGAPAVAAPPSPAEASARSVRRGLAKLQSLRADAVRKNDAMAGAVNALAGIAFLQSGSTADDGEFAADLSDCRDAVIAAQDDSGLIGGRTAVMYVHGVSTRFLAMDYAATRDKRVKDALKRAVALTVRSQNKAGGWRYLPTSLDSDVSVTSCQIVGLRAAADAGIPVDAGVFDRAGKYVLSCQNDDGGSSYIAEARNASGPGRSAAAVAALIDVRLADGQPRIDRGLKYLSGFFPKGAGEAHFYYGAYYAAHALVASGGDHADREFPALREVLVAMQQGDGTWRGDFSDAYATASALIALQSGNVPFHPK